MKVYYSQLRKELGIVDCVECDTYKIEVHPVTGKLTLYLYQMIGSTTYANDVISGVLWIHVER